MEKRVVQYPSRSIDIRITEPDCGDRHFARGVIATLRHIADSMERDDKKAYERGGHDTSGFMEPQGQTAFITTHEVTIYPAGKKPRPAKDLRCFDIEWAAADQHYIPGENHD